MKLVICAVCASLSLLLSGFAFVQDGYTAGRSTLTYTAEVAWTQRNFYQHVFALGDVNSDNNADIGAYDDNGKVAVWFGSDTGLAATKSQTATFVRGQGAIIPVCDPNHDGYADVVVTEDSGYSWYVPGSGSGLLFTKKMKIGDGGWAPRLTVGCFGDVTGDAIDDVVVVTAKKIQVLSGGSNFPRKIPSASTICTKNTCGVYVMGDVNGDGVRDVGVVRKIAGKIFFEVYGGGTKVFERTPIVKITNPAGYRNTYFASTAAGIGDVNGDGLVDIAIAQYWDGVFIYYGTASGYPKTPDKKILGMDVGIVSSAGDLNDDGYTDVFVGSPQTSTARVYLGSAAGLADTPAWVATGDGHFGWPGGDAGDVDGNGLNDLFVGAHYYGGEARVYLFK